jgi:NMD protein affecting ribosome stability and mRNA decay
MIVIENEILICVSCGEEIKKGEWYTYDPWLQVLCQECDCWTEEEIDGK